MSKVTIVLADTDEVYAENVYHYMMSNYASRFDIILYTNGTYLKEFLSNHTKSIDILLISPELYDKQMSLQNITCFIFLTAGKLATPNEGYPCINKYQHGGQLVSNIISAFAQFNQEEVAVIAGNKATKIIGIYSPIGGAGKTTVAVCASVISAASGFSVFYLDLENTSQSSPYYFENSNSHNFSNVLFALKERSKNIALKIEGCRCIDQRSNVHYFLPPDSITEMSELTSEEYQTLIQQLKMIGEYDYIFIDMSSTFDTRCIDILDGCDQIMMVVTPQVTDNIKISSLYKELDILLQKSEINLKEKIIIVQNKTVQESSSPHKEDLHHIDMQINFFLPAEREQLTTQQFLNINYPFADSVAKMLKEIE